jgi:hypothetical protein
MNGILLVASHILVASRLLAASADGWADPL